MLKDTIIVAVTLQADTDIKVIAEINTIMRKRIVRAVLPLRGMDTKVLAVANTEDIPNTKKTLLFMC